MPRLSVDIDLCYLPINSRAESFKEMHRILSKIKSEIEKLLRISVIPNHPLNGNREAKLNISRDNVVIKVEPNYILRGSLFDPQEKEIANAVQIKFEKTATAFILDPIDLYGGKFCAALDRQHPRDLFDVYNFFKASQISEDIKDAFLFYVLSHNRPIHELLDARDLQIEDIYEKEFQGMVSDEISISDLQSARAMLKVNLLKSLDDRDKKFLLSFVNNEPDWNCYNHPKIKDFPSIRWKLFNLSKADETKKKKQADLLNKVLSK